jgi:thioredoxin-like negative regulator of GroEL
MRRLQAGRPPRTLGDALDPGNDDTRYDYAKLLIELGGFEEAEAALAPKLAEIPRKLRFEALSQWLNALLFIATSDYSIGLSSNLMKKSPPTNATLTRALPKPEC